MPVRTLELLWQFLTGRLENPEMRCDLFIDLFFQFKRLEGLELQPLTPQRVRIRSDRWPTGLDPEVAEVRAQNRDVCSTSWCRRSRTASRPLRGSVSRRG